MNLGPPLIDRNETKQTNERTSLYARFDQSSKNENWRRDLILSSLDHEASALTVMPWLLNVEGFDNFNTINKYGSLIFKSIFNPNVYKML